MLSPVRNIRVQVANLNPQEDSPCGIYQIMHKSGYGGCKARERSCIENTASEPQHRRQRALDCAWGNGEGVDGGGVDWVRNMIDPESIVACILRCPDKLIIYDQE